MAYLYSSSIFVLIVSICPALTSASAPFEYDFIIVGAGSAGCVLANRLSEIGHWSILLVEAGHDEIFLTDIPLLASYMTATDYNWGYKTEPQPGRACIGLVNGRCNWPRGKAVGGTSVINYMLYTRGFPGDYDQWARLGNAGWSYADVFPYFLKSEHIVVTALQNSTMHARRGPLNVDRPTWRSPLAPLFMDACRELGYETGDPDGLNPMGCSYVLTNTKQGARFSAAKAFLKPILARRKNLTLSRRSRVLRILMDEFRKRAIGVEFVRNQRRYRAFATKEVIVCAGALNSPQLLMLSGIGPAQHLQRLNITTVQHLPGVGANLQDHVSMAGLAFLVNASVALVENRFQAPKYAFEYLLRGAGPYTNPGGAEAILFTRTECCAADRTGGDASTPDMELVFGPGSLTGDTGGSLKRLFNIDNKLYEKVYRPSVGKDGWTLVPILLKPKSRGYVRLKSKNPFQPPLLYANYFEDESDLRALVEGIKMAITISETHSLQKYSSRVLQLRVPQCNHLQVGSDEHWMCVTRYITTNLHHQVGTCKMGPADDVEAVVDSQLRVIGVAGLRVVDASIMPIIPAAHTNAVVYMIAEKAADMIKQSWSTIRKKKTSH